MFFNIMTELNGPKLLSEEERNRLDLQNNRLISEHKANLLEIEASKHWDLFYKRNETRFFKDRHWTTREFTDLLSKDTASSLNRTKLLEVGCGVGNFIFPLIEENLNYFIYACDFSPRAVEFVKQNKLYDEKHVKAFKADITTNDVLSVIEVDEIDVITLVFVLSAIHPDKFLDVLKNLYKLLKPGGVVLFRDYGLYDMAQLRFKAGHKISENFYMRQDGTRSFYFSVEHVKDIFGKAGFDTISNVYIHRRTINKKENVDVPRIFVQGQFRKPYA